MTEKIKTAFNKAAATYDQVTTVQKNIGQQLIQSLPCTVFAHVIDLGCGTGWTTRALAQHIHFVDFSAVDLSEAMIGEAWRQNACSKILFQVQSFNDLIPNQYNLIFSNMALHWSTDFFTTLGNIYAALQSKSLIAFSVPLPETFEELKPHFDLRHFYSVEKIVNLLKQQGFVLKNQQCVHKKLLFSNTLQALRELKKTGATACETTTSSYKQCCFAIKNNLILELTYHVGLFIAEKK